MAEEKLKILYLMQMLLEETDPALTLCNYFHICLQFFNIVGCLCEHTADNALDL